MGGELYSVSPIMKSLPFGEHEIDEKLCSYVPVTDTDIEKIIFFKSIVLVLPSLYDFLDSVLKWWTKFLRSDFIHPSVCLFIYMFFCFLYAMQIIFLFYNTKCQTLNCQKLPYNT